MSGNWHCFRTNDATLQTCDSSRWDSSPPPAPPLPSPPQRTPRIIHGTQSHVNAQDVCLREEVLGRDIWIGRGGGGWKGWRTAEERRRKISDSNVFRSTAVRLVVLISLCNRGSMPLARLREGRKEKKRTEKEKKKTTGRSVLRSGTKSPM